MLRSLRRTAVKTAAAAGVTLTAVELTTHLPSQGRSSKFYHDASDRIVMPLVRFGLDPETAHNLAVEVVRRGWGPRYRPGVGSAGGREGDEWRVEMRSTPFRRRPVVQEEKEGGTTSTDEDEGPPSSSPSSSRLVFPNPIGLAAGFDKDGVAVRGLMELGFGFVEVGSVTPLPQPGNPQPRMFRLTEDRGVVNRYGFNSAGLDEVEANLREFRGLGAGATAAIVTSGNEIEDGQSKDDASDLKEDDKSVGAALMGYLWAQTKRQTKRLILLLLSPPPSEPLGLLGVNLGRNKSSTTDEEVEADYTRGIRQLGPYADYLVVNISSPNTPGLRGLQRREPLRRLLNAAVRERDALPTQQKGGSNGRSVGKPLLVKIAPDLSEQEMADVAAVVRESRSGNGGVDGIIISNTSTSRPSNLTSRYRNEPGGLSGGPIRDMSTECIRTMYRLTDGTVPIIGVGGVGSGRDAYDKLRAGASLVQVYSMMVYEGPGLVARIRSELAGLMVQNGQRRVEDVVGLDHEDIYWRRREERLREERSVERVFVEE